MSKITVDENWSLFLSRDGVINKEMPNGVVTNWDEFEFLPDVLRTLRYCGMFFGKVFVVTNQPGVGMELLTKDQLHEIHNNMVESIKAEGGRITRVYYCPDSDDEEESPCRKPDIGMGMWVIRDYPDIDFSKAIMVGSKLTDMRFSLTLGMESFLITDKNIDPETGLKTLKDLPGLLEHISL